MEQIPRLDDFANHVMRHEIVTTAEQWRALRREWNALLAESSANSLFMTWEWLDSWLEVRDYRPSLLIVCVRGENGELLGAAPFYETDYDLVRVLPYRMLRMVGDVDSGAEYQTWLARRTCEREAFAAIAAALRSLKSQWDLLWMPKLPGWPKGQESLLDALRAGGLAANHRPHSFSAVCLPRDYEAYLARMSASRRGRVRNISRRILSRPGVEVRRVRSKSELRPALTALFDLHGKRWRAAGQDGVFVRSPKEKAFYECFVPRALEAGWLALYTLFEDGEPKAVQIGYIYDGVFLQLQEGFDPDHVRDFGNALRAYVIQDCIAGGLREYDFLGGISEHKRRWMAEQRVGIDVLAAAPHLKNVPIMHARVWPTGAYLRPRGAAPRPRPQVAPAPALSRARD